jgi:hypothetical protein
MSATEYEIDTEKTIGGLQAPADWHIIQKFGPEGMIWERLFGNPLRVIETIADKEDGRNWLHVSVSKRNKKIPSYDELAEVRRIFIGKDRECYMVWPPNDRYVNLHPAVLHLYCCLDEPHGVLPHFEGKINIGGEEILSI